MRPSPQPSRFVHYLSHSSQTNKQATNKPTDNDVYCQQHQLLAQWAQ